MISITSLLNMLILLLLISLQDLLLFYRFGTCSGCSQSSALGGYTVTHNGNLHDESLYVPWTKYLKLTSIPSFSKTFSIWATLYFKSYYMGGDFGDIFYQNAFMDLEFDMWDGCEFKPVLMDSLGTTQLSTPDYDDVFNGANFWDRWIGLLFTANAVSSTKSDFTISYYDYS